MSCWVVPSIAADLWGVSLQQIMEGTKDGQIPSKTELGRLFVDVAPNSPRLQAPQSLRPPSPPTYQAVSPEEIAALTGDAGDESADEQTIDLGDWRQARQSACKLRRPPALAA